MVEPGALAGVRVVELSHAAGAVAGRVLADLGADVVKIEPPGGEAGRGREPLGEVGGEPVSWFWHVFNLGKRSVQLDLVDPGDLERAGRLVGCADIVLTDHERVRPAADCDRLRAALGGDSPDVVWAEIWPYGRGGSYEDLPGSDLVAQASGGHLHLNGDTDRAPVAIGLPVATLQAGVEAAGAALMAYFHRLRTGRGQRVDVSMQECVTWTMLNTTMMWQLLGRDETRGGAVRKERANTYYTRLVWDCRGGHVHFGPVGGGGGVARERSYAALVAWMREEGADHPLLTARDWNGADQYTIAQTDYDRVAEIIGDFLRGKTAEELMERAVRDRILLAQVSSVSQVLHNPHLRARGFFVPAPGPDGRPVELPGPFARLSRTPIGPYRRPPRPGEHTAEVLASPELAPPDPEPPERAPCRTEPREQVFSGLKVADFTWAAAGPIMTKQLADNGAVVVKIESRRHPDSMRLGGPFTGDIPGIDRSGFFADFNSSKLSLALDMTRPEARAVALRLAEWADVVADSFRPGVLDRWGIGYDALRRVNPKLIMVSSSLYGASGPWKDHPGYGAQGAALAGIHGLTGWPDRPPAAPKGAYTDSVTPRYGLAALVAALIHRERTGEGQRIELSQVEAGVEFLAPELMRLQVTGEEVTRRGNRGEGSLLHGVYPCAGEDRWIAIEVRDRAEWDGLVGVLGEPGDPGHADEQVAAATARHDPFELAAKLRAAGVPAGVVARGSDLFDDPVLAERGHFRPLPHPEMGTVGYNGPAYRFSDTPTVLTRAAPCLGQDTDDVLRGLLGYSATEIAGLRDQGILH